MSSSETKLRATVTDPMLETAVKAYLAGNEHAFNTVLYPYIDKIITQMLRKKHYPGYQSHMDDIRQECWAGAMKNLRLWDPARGTLKNYLFKCFANRAMIYLHRVGSTRVHVPLEDIADSHSGTPIDVFEQDLNIRIPSRFTDEREVCIIRRVAVAVFLRVFDGRRNRLVRELREWTGYSLCRVKFLVEYALLIVRRYCLGALCPTVA